MTIGELKEARGNRFKKSNRQECIDTVAASGMMLLVVDLVLLILAFSVIMWISSGGYNPSYLSLWVAANAIAVYTIALIPSLAVGAFVGGVVYPNIYGDD